MTDDHTDLTICCLHVFNKESEPEYNEEDDTNICTKCRDLTDEVGWETFGIDNLRTVCRECMFGRAKE